MNCTFRALRQSRSPLNDVGRIAPSQIVHHLLALIPSYTGCAVNLLSVVKSNATVVSEDDQFSFCFSRQPLPEWCFILLPVAVVAVYRDHAFQPYWELIIPLDGCVQKRATTTVTCQNNIIRPSGRHKTKPVNNLTSHITGIFALTFPGGPAQFRSLKKCDRLVIVSMSSQPACLRTNMLNADVPVGFLGHAPPMVHSMEFPFGKASMTRKC